MLQNTAFTVLKKIRSVFIDLLTYSYSSAACLKDVMDYMGWDGAEVGAFPNNLKLGSRT